MLESQNLFILLLLSLFAAPSVVAQCTPGTGRVITGSATTDTVASGDCGNVVDHDQAATKPVNQTLPTATTLGNSSFFYFYSNHSAQVDTITPTTWTIQLGGAAAASSANVPPGGYCRMRAGQFPADQIRVARSRSI